MQVMQLYETRLIGKTSDHAAHVIVVPARCFSAPVPPADAPNVSQTAFQTRDVLDDLELQEVAPVAPHHLAQALAMLVSPSMPTDALKGQLSNLGEKVAGLPCSAEPYAKADIEFAEQLAFACDIPFENSPLSGETLIKLVTKATGAGIGAFAGFVAFGTSPFLLIMVPAGMVLCGAAKGIAEALESGLRERLTDWLKGKRKRGKAAKG